MSRKQCNIVAYQASSACPPLVIILEQSLDVKHGYQVFGRPRTGWGIDH
jgi:hypothetical protein